MVSWTRPIAAWMSVIRSLKPTTSFSYWTLHALVAVEPHQSLDLGVGDRDHAALAGGHVLGGVEREHREGAERADGRAVQRGAVGLRRVLEDLEPVLPGDRSDAVHVGRMPVEVHGHDGRRCGRDACRDVVGSRQKVSGLDVGEDGRSARQCHRVGGRGEGERRDDDLVAWPDPGASRPRWSPDVPELTATQARPRSKCSANSCSNAATSGPWASMPPTQHPVDGRALLVADQGAGRGDEVLHGASSRRSRPGLLDVALTWSRCTPIARRRPG